MNLLIRFLAWACRIMAASAEPGRSRDGPPCTLRMFAGVKSKPVAATNAKNWPRARFWDVFAKGHT